MKLLLGRLTPALVVLLALAAATPDAAAPSRAAAAKGSFALETPAAETAGKAEAAEKKAEAGEREAAAAEESASPPAILHSIGAAISNELNHSRYQGLNAAIAFVFGCVMVFDGESVFKWLVIGVVTIVACIMAKNEATYTLKLDEGSLVGDFVGIEVGALVAWAAYVGIDGVMILVSAIIGGLLADSLQKVLASHGVALVEHRLLVVVFFTAWVAFAVWLFKRKGHLSWLAVLSPIIGGALVSSAVSFAVTELATHRMMAWFAQHGLQPAGGNWTAFLQLLCGGPDVGLFVGSPRNPAALGGRWPLDRIFGCLLWLILFYCGAQTQLRKVKEEQEGKVAARELSDPLLQP